jgi:hypothetical protein
MRAKGGFVMWYNKPKYSNQKTTIDGITFDSKKEADRYCELLFLQRAGLISNLELQKKFELIPAQYEYFERYGKQGQRLKDGKKCLENSITYVADFVYTENGKTVVEDTKGMKTKEYIIKRKLMLYIHGIRIKEV